MFVQNYKHNCDWELYNYLLSLPTHDPHVVAFKFLVSRGFLTLKEQSHTFTELRLHQTNRGLSLNPFPRRHAMSWVEIFHCSEHIPLSPLTVRLVFSCNVPLPTSFYTMFPNKHFNSWLWKIVSFCLISAECYLQLFILCSLKSKQQSIDPSEKICSAKLPDLTHRFFIL